MKLRMIASLAFAGTMTALVSSANGAVTVGQTGKSRWVSLWRGVRLRTDVGGLGEPLRGSKHRRYSSWKVTSWSSFGASSGIQLKHRFFRATATPDEYQRSPTPIPRPSTQEDLPGTPFRRTSRCRPVTSSVSTR